MAYSTSISVTTGSGAPGSLVFDWLQYQAYSDEEYKTNPLINFVEKNIVQGNFPYEESYSTSVRPNGKAAYDYRAAISIEDVYDKATVFVYNDPYLNIGGIGTFSEDAGHARLDWGDIEFTHYDNVASLPTYITKYTGQYVTDLEEWTLSTNIPIFLTNAEASNYIATGDGIANALNNSIPSIPKGSDFEIVNIWTEGTWNTDGTYVSGSDVYHHDVRGRILEGARIATYPADQIVDGALILYVVTSGDFYNCEYSSDGTVWIDAGNQFPYTFLYRKRVDELGHFKFALTSYDNLGIPNFKDETTAQGYLNDDVPITEATNWDEISDHYPDYPNPTGEDDPGTDWGHVYTRCFFQQQYLCGSGAVQEISNALYDTSPNGIWEDIKKGLEMFGQNPMDAVASLMYYPIDLTTVFQYTSSSSSVWFGGYQFQLQSHTVNKLIYPDGFYYCGGLTIQPRTKDWRDIYATRIFIDLPYCGRYELDPAKYMGKYVKVIYYIDLHTGACIACLVDGAGNTRDGKCLDQFNGQMGVNCPITLTDFSGYANAQINTLLGNGGQAISAAQSVGETGAHAAIGSATSAGALMSIGGAAAGGAALGAIQGAKTVYGLTMNNINKFNQTRGGSTGMLNQYANQKPTLIFVYPETDLPANFNAMYGTPSNAGGTISNFYGYFEADTVKLNMPGATESEKEKARALLMGGVYIQ